MNQAEAYRVICSFVETFPSIGTAINAAASDKIPFERFLGIQANQILKYEMDECREVYRDWTERYEREPFNASLAAVLRSPEIGLNIAAIIREKRDRAAKEEQADITRKQVAADRAGFLEQDGAAAAVVAEMIPHHRSYLEGLLTGREYKTLLEAAYERHGFKDTQAMYEY